MPKTTDNSGVYLLEIFNSKEFFLEKFGINFRKGYYYYTGSAQKNLSSRIERHFRKEKKIHWHIDYLTSHPNTYVTNAWLYYSRSKVHECLLNQKLSAEYGLTAPVKGFGSSDCPKCNSHLLFSPGKILISF